MKKNITRILVIVLIFSVFSSTALIANASIQASYYISSCDAQITTGYGGQILVDCGVTGTGVMDTIGVSTLVIQRYQSGSWVNVASWSSLYDYYSASSAVEATYYGTAGSQYRAVITFYAALNGGSDSRIMTTRSVTAVN